MQPMFDFHTHTLLSDGALIPAEAVRRAEIRGYRIMGLSDHADLATLPTQMPLVIAAARAENASGTKYFKKQITKAVNYRQNVW